VRVKNTYGVAAATSNLGSGPSPTSQSQRPLTGGEADKLQTTSTSPAEAEAPAPPTVAPPPKPTMPGKLSEEPKTDYRLWGLFIGIVLFAMFVMIMAGINWQSAKDSAPVQDSSQLSTTPAASRDFSKEDLSAIRILDFGTYTRKSYWAQFKCVSCTEAEKEAERNEKEEAVWLTVSNKSQSTLHSLKTQVTLPAYHISGESLEFDCQHTTLQGNVPEIGPNTTGTCVSGPSVQVWDSKASFLITGAQVPEH
jgi:hypothetical protein